MSNPVMNANVCPAPSSSMSAQSSDGFDVPEGVAIKPAEGFQGSLGMFEVTIDGQTQLMTREQIRNTNFQQCFAAPTPDQQVQAELSGKAQIGAAGPFIVAVPRGTPTPAASGGKSMVVPGSSDIISTAGAMEMSNRTGHGISGLTKGSLAGVSELTLVAHSYPSGNVDINGASLSPEALARQLYDAGFRGGTLRLAVCQANAGGSTSIAQRVVNELARLGAETTAIASNGNVSILSQAHGLPQVRTPGVPQRQAAGQGWDYVTPEVPTMRVPPTLARGAAVAGVGLNVLNVVTALKFAWDFAKMMEFKDSLKAGQYFKDFWMSVSALPDGARVEMDGEIGTVDMSKGIQIHFKNSKNEWTIKMIGDGGGGFGMRISGTDDGKYVEYTIDKKGVRGGEVI